MSNTKMYADVRLWLPMQLGFRYLSKSSMVTAYAHVKNNLSWWSLPLSSRSSKCNNLCVHDQYQTISLSALFQQSFCTASLGLATLTSQLLICCSTVSSASDSLLFPVLFTFRSSRLPYDLVFSSSELVFNSSFIRASHLWLPLLMLNPAASLEPVLQKQSCSVHTGACSALEQLLWTGTK